ncbi:MAG: hypothetical protein ABIJ19_00255 [Patescibacteria group bacterium]
MTKFVICHHAERADRSLGVESERYWGLTRTGVAQAREKTKILVKTISDAPGGSVIVLGGCSKAIRTKSTLMVFTDELRQIFAGEKNVLFSEHFNATLPLDSLKRIAKESDNGKNKIVVDFPLRIEEFIAPLGQRECKVAREIIAGLYAARGFFRRFFPNNPLVLVNVGHALGIDALVNFLAKENGKHGDNVSFSFM